ETVQAASVVEPYVTDNDQPLGYVDVYVWNGVDSASTALVNAAQTIIDGYTTREGQRVAGYVSAGVVATVKPTVERYVDMAATVTPRAGYQISDVAAKITQAIDNYISSLRIGAGFVVNEAVARAMDVEGVENFVTSDTD